MKIVLIYPKYPDTFWSFRHALKFVSKKATDPPLGLLTVAAMLPEKWEKKLIDMNVMALKDRDLKDVDLVFVSGMSIQKASAEEVIYKCKKLGIKVVAGGPLFTTQYNLFDNVDYFVLNEAEITLPLFLEDFRNGTPKHIYQSNEFADIENTPKPLWGLINKKKYVSLDIQYSRGCPFNCDFCDVTNLFGRKFRSKNKEQVISELENIYSSGWRGTVFFVDDNFIGNRKKLKNEILPAIIEWMKIKSYPFTFNTQASIDLSDDDELLNLMIEAGFTSVFVGIETPNTESLTECHKSQNKNRDLVACIKKIHKSGLQVTGGFIVGFDNDSPSIFDTLSDFIKESGIITAMVGLLNAPLGTRLYQRLDKDNRIIKEFSGDNTNYSMNFIPKMNFETLVKGYNKVLSKIYSPKYYYERVKKFLKEFKPPQKKHFNLKAIPLLFSYAGALFKSIWYLGIKDDARVYYWKLFFFSLFKRPKLFVSAITYAIYGFHFRKVFKL
ncbi:MAG TPA: B12-binding domain-containing radical SAM protein [Bacteroidota bacterium]|nr:B12-binding domain-containing radical SAM protein [Bacteroidota bacterium]